MLVWCHYAGDFVSRKRIQHDAYKAHPWLCLLAHLRKFGFILIILKLFFIQKIIKKLIAIYNKKKGEMKLLDELDNSECTNESCPEPSGVIYSYVALMIYMITANILLVNLLIAMFSSTFQDVQDNTDEIWRFQRYRLVFEYYDSSILPPPINFVAYLISIGAYLKNLGKEKIEYDDSK